MPKVLLIILYSFYPLFLLFSFLFDNAAGIILFIIFLLALLFITVINIIVSIKLIKEKQFAKLIDMALMIKLGLIPFWVTNFIICFLIVIGTIAIFFVWIYFIPAAIILTYIVFLTTSVFSTSYIRLLHKNKHMSFGKMIFHIILQLCFFWDIIDTIYLKIRYNKYNKESSPLGS